MCDNIFIWSVTENDQFSSMNIKIHLLLFFLNNTLIRNFNLDLQLKWPTVQNFHLDHQLKNAI